MATELIFIYECESLIDPEVLANCEAKLRESGIDSERYYWTDRRIFFALNDPWIKEDIEKMGGKGPHFYELNLVNRSHPNLLEAKIMSDFIGYSMHEIHPLAVWYANDSDQKFEKFNDLESSWIEIEK